MKPGIALLLSGGPEDLTASICAVQLAARSDSKLYALQSCFMAKQDPATERVPEGKPPKEDRFISSFSFVVEFSGIEGVQVSCHLLESEEIEQMVEFVTVHAISCLVVTGGNTKQEDRKTGLSELQKKYIAGLRQFHPDLQVITAPTWEEMDIKQVVRQFRRLDRLAPGKIK